ncbi:hypothetical protein PRZ48_001757 [Zasmidium cellare]|uniref:Zn(2)-C6 fungal-type domain-containing protein n=1 Tax=Zasmidium cellare TaxID=395010 RepID=A0ABR0F2D1_ZASCE|nr:hypothetical protein PRZ48_001757 [Zasmidium cellare]
MGGTAIDPALASEDITENNADLDGEQLPPNTQPGPPGQPVHPPVQNVQPVQPVMHDQYRLPPVFAPGYPQQPQMGGYPPAQPAPRQRTAIACRYCRRRKIRCSGFDQSEDGRCTNCVRFSQECIFTPVSAQTQAFVPAHALYRGQNAPANQPLYGAYGQPLPPNANRDQQQYQPQQQQPGQYPPTPQGYQQPSMYPQQPPQGTPQMQGTNPEAGRKRPNDEPHTPTLPPPYPGTHAQMPQHRGPGGDGYSYPDPSGHPPAGASPASSTTSYPYHPQTYYTQPMAQARRASPQSAYSYDGSRASSSPHTLGPPGTPNSFHHPGMPLSRDGRAPPTSAAANAQRPGGKINAAKLEGRTFTDNNMVQALNRGPK